VGKADLKREITTYAAPRGRFQLVEVASAQFLAVDGHGDPNTAAAYADALATIYPMAYRLKFASKTTLDRDYGVMPLEALWWSDDLATFTSARDKSRWSWRLLNLVPSWLGADDVARARSAVERTGHAPALRLLRYETFDEGLVVQTLHVGPYDDEGPVLAAMHRHIVDEGFRLAGRHHEVYLSDPRRTAPERLRTILRQPVRRRGTR
jgi:hypothetical protein